MIWISIFRVIVVLWSILSLAIFRLKPFLEFFTCLMLSSRRYQETLTRTCLSVSHKSQYHGGLVPWRSGCTNAETKENMFQPASFKGDCCNSFFTNFSRSVEDFNSATRHAAKSHGLYIASDVGVSFRGLHASSKPIKWKQALFF